MRDLEEFLKKVPLFSSIPESQIREMAGLFTTDTYERGAVVCRQGEDADTMFIIRSGVVGVQADQGDGEHFLAELHRGDFFGEMALLANAPRNATVRVVLDAVIFSLSREAFQTLLSQNKSMGLYLSRVYARRISSTDGRAGEQEKFRGTRAVFYAVSASDSELGLSHFLYSLSYHIATESHKKVLVVEPHLELSTIMKKLGLFEMICPDTGLFRLLPPNIYRGDDFHWYSHQAGFSVLQVKRGFSEHLCKAVPLLMEGFRDSFDLILFSLSHRLNELERLLVRLCDKNLLLINNTEHALPRIRERLDLIENIAGPGLDRVRVGVSHLCGERGIPRQVLKKKLNLSETPGIWVDRSDAAYAERIDTEKCFPIKGARAVAREIAGVRVGLALGAGAARGWAHIGVLKVLEEEGIHVDMIAGTSIGALVGGIYGASASVDHLTRHTIERFSTKGVARRQIFDFTLPVKGLIRGGKVMRMVSRAVSNADFLDLLIPTYIVAVDILTGEEVLFETGDVTRAVRGSISIPGVFTPFNHKGRWLVDGGLLNPVPVDVLARKGADKIIAVCIEQAGPAGNGNGPGVSGSSGAPATQAPSGSFMQSGLSALAGLPAQPDTPGIKQVISQTISIVHGRATGDFAKQADVVIYPDVAGFKWDDFHRGKVLMKKGETACRDQLKEIVKLIG